jgi:hypothetical protein
LKSLVANGDNNVYSDKIIHHFPGGPGSYQHKIESMTAFLNSIKNNNNILTSSIKVQKSRDFRKMFFNWTEKH